MSWKEEFENRICWAHKEDFENSEINYILKEVKQFIIDLRKQDEETITDILMTNSNVLNSIELIKDYYKE